MYMCCVFVCVLVLCVRCTSESIARNNTRTREKNMKYREEEGGEGEEHKRERR